MAIEREKHTLDATGLAVGRLATQIATLLQGKHKPTYEPHVDAGDFVEIENAGALKIEAKRSADKFYYRHTQYPGGLKSVSQKKMFAEDPSQIVIEAVSRMLPKNKLRAPRMKRLTFKN